MKLKKILIGSLSVTMLSTSIFTAFATDTKDLNVDNNVEEINNVIPINAEINEEQRSYFNSFTGTVKEINDHGYIENAKMILVEQEEDQIAHFIISDDTYVADDVKIEVGSVITGFFRADKPMILIYPPQYNTRVIISDSEEENFKVDIFDEDLVSADNALKLNISDDTEIIWQDGAKFDGELKDKEIVVFYGASTRSIPAQTTPSKIVVLFEEESANNQDNEDNIQEQIGDVSTMDIVVNNKKIEAPAAYINDKDTIMVPLRAIAEALEFDVGWDGETQEIRLGNGISLTIGKDYYIYMRTAPISLGTAPELVDETTFVPLSFFKEVVRMNNAYVFEGQIVIDNEEVME